MAKQISADELLLRQMGLVPFDEREDRKQAEDKPAEPVPVKQPAASTPKPQKPKPSAKTAPQKPKAAPEKAPVVQAAADEPIEYQTFSVRIPASLVDRVEDIVYRRNANVRKRTEKYSRQKFIQEALEEKLSREKN